MEIPPDIFENTKVAFAGKSDGDLQKDKAVFTLFNNSSLVKLGSSVATFALKLHLPVSPLFKWTVYNHFCGGETFAECKVTIQKLNEKHVGVLLNYGVELKETEEDFDKTVRNNLEALEFGEANKSVKALCIKPSGYGRFALFEKVQSGRILTADETAEYERVKERFHKLCKVAEQKQVPLYVDAEESWIQDALDALAEELMEKYNRKTCVVYNTFQLYRWDRLAYLEKEIERAKTGGYILGAKLVRGAYMEKERERAREMNYKSPIGANKAAVDRDFDAAVRLCLDNLQQVHLCVATQNEKSSLLAIQEMNRRKINAHKAPVVFSQLYGMGDNLTFNLAALGFSTAKYLPYGPVKDVIPYLIRRAQENTSISGQTGRELTLIKKEIRRRKSLC